LIETLALIVAGFAAGAINAVAGGGPLITLPILIFAGLDARLANLTSTVALFPGQIATAHMARSALRPINGVRVSILLGINIAGGALGALLLLTTPSSLFAKLVPWLILVATAIYAWSNFSTQVRNETSRIGRFGFIAAQILISIYGGYFGGGNSFIMLALLTVTGLTARDAGQLKNLLIALINVAAACIFLLSSAVDYNKAILLGIGAIAGSMAGVSILHRLNETVLKIAVISIGATLTFWLFWSA
jgi:uncharacterized protein